MAVCGADWLLKNGDLVPDRSPHSSTADVKLLDSELAGLSLADKPGDGGSDGSSDRDSTSASAGEEDADPKKDPTAQRRRKRGKPKGKAAPPPQYPLLPGEPACAYFLKTGTCRFGANCKFNHQRRWKKNRVKRNDAVETSHVKPKNALELSQVKPKDAVEPSQAAKEEKKTLPESVECMQCKDVIKEKEKEKETLPEKVILIESKKVEKDKEKETNTERADQAKCKFYLTPLGCKFGKDCKFLHDVDKIDVGPIELNFLGLPKRRGEKNCPYYMRTGGCKYATKCRYHHPDPIAVGGQDPHSTYQTSGSAQLHVSGTPPLPSASWPLQISNETVPFYDSSPSYATGVFLPPQGQYPNPQWNGYQAPVYPWYATDISIRHPSALPIDDATRNIDGFVHQKPEFDEYPERPGQKECQYFMKTGDCKFKSACKFHHPKSRLSKASAAT